MTTERSTRSKANGNGGTLQIRGQGIVNKGKLEAKGTNGRLILAYETSFFNFGTLDYNQKIEMTRPQITGVLDASVSYSVRTPAVAEDSLTAWFRFEETSGTTTSSDFGGFTGTLQGNSGNLPAFTSSGKFGNAVEFSTNEWIKTDAFADLMDIDGAKPRTISVWFVPANGQNNGGEAGLFSMGDITIVWLLFGPNGLFADSGVVRITHASALNTIHGMWRLRSPKV